MKYIWNQWTKCYFNKWNKKKWYSSKLLSMEYWKKPRIKKCQKVCAFSHYFLSLSSFALMKWWKKCLHLLWLRRNLITSGIIAVKKFVAKNPLREISLGKKLKNIKCQKLNVANRNIFIIRYKRNAFRKWLAHKVFSLKTEHRKQRIFSMKKKLFCTIRTNQNLNIPSKNCLNVFSCLQKTFIYRCHNLKIISHWAQRTFNVSDGLLFSDKISILCVKFIVFNINLLVRNNFDSIPIRQN